MLPLHTILHPTDFSGPSKYAFRVACALARDYGARLVLLHVGRQPVIGPVEGVAPPEPERYQERLTAELRHMQAENPDLHIEPELIIASDSAAEIVRVARQTKADLIVLGTHGRTGLGRVLMGSVAEGVSRQAPCPVLTVKTPLPEAPPAGKTLAEATGGRAEAVRQ